MGIHIQIRKIREDSRAADYEFRLDDRPGMLRLDKRTGAVLLIDVDPCDGMAFRCAARKVMDHWQNGVLPEQTSWAA
jgi:hypothetical protein